MSSPADKLQEQLQEVWAYVASLLNFPLGKLALALAGIWWSWFFSPLLEFKLLAFIPILWVLDFVTGTISAIHKGTWTFRDMTAGCYRGVALAIVLFVAYVSALFAGRWLFVGVVTSAFITESASILDNLIDVFPNSSMLGIIKPLLKFLRKRYKLVQRQLVDEDGNPEEKEGNNDVSESA